MYEFCLDFESIGLNEEWYLEELTINCPSKAYFKLPVPASFNDITGDKRARNFVGWLWYEKKFLNFFDISQYSNSNFDTYLRFDSANYLALVWLDGLFVGSHVGGHLPFSFEIGSIMSQWNNKYNKTSYSNMIKPMAKYWHRLTIAISNELNDESLPTGKVIETRVNTKIERRLEPNFDFFHYSGLLGDVNLILLPVNGFVENVELMDTKLSFDANNSEIALNAKLTFALSIKQLRQNTNVLIEIIDLNERSSGFVVVAKKSFVITRDKKKEEIIRIIDIDVDRPKLWHPNARISNKDADELSNRKLRLLYQANMYKIRTTLRYLENDDGLAPRSGADIFEMCFGIREFGIVCEKFSTDHTPQQFNQNLFVPFRHKQINSDSESDRCIKSQLKLNNKLIKLHGFGTHIEQYPSGRTMSLASMATDFNIFKRLSVNTIRTSHYPYPESWLQLADESGIMVIGELPAVGLTFSYTPTNNRSDINATSDDESLEYQLKLHKLMFAEMLFRDSSHASIIAWSLANEPQSQLSVSRQYFSELSLFARNLLATRWRRPITAAIAQHHSSDCVSQLLDIIMVNRYFGWYEFGGLELELVSRLLFDSINGFSLKYGSGKPILVSEFGADAIHGFSSLNGKMFDEQYQRKLVSECHKAFDKLYDCGNVSFVGELSWNFGDFETVDSLSRPFGTNYKGAFTRTREPKLVADTFESRYSEL